jgi:hypothetical protein
MHRAQWVVGALCSVRGRVIPIAFALLLPRALVPHLDRATHVFQIADFQVGVFLSGFHTSLPIYKFTFHDANLAHTRSSDNAGSGWQWSAATIRSGLPIAAVTCRALGRCHGSLPCRVDTPCTYFQKWRRFSATHRLKVFCAETVGTTQSQMRLYSIRTEFDQALSTGRQPTKDEARAYT